MPLDQDVLLTEPEVVRPEPEVGFEPTTARLQGGCSDRLSYSGAVTKYLVTGQIFALPGLWTHRRPAVTYTR